MPGSKQDQVIEGPQIYNSFGPLASVEAVDITYDSRFERGRYVMDVDLMMNLIGFTESI